MSELICLGHDQKSWFGSEYYRVKHEILIPASLVGKLGTYHFALRVWDNHANLHKDHKVKPALELNQTAQQLPPIVYINRGNWHVAWCLLGRGVTFRTIRFNPAEECVARDFTNSTPQGYVRAAINGGFFYPIRVRGRNDPKQDPFATDPKRRVRIIAEVGTGTKGNWQYGEALPATGPRRRPKRWCFGMDAKGQIRISLMEERTENGEKVFQVHRQNIENLFPYGLSNVGLLVRNGRRVDPPIAWPDPNIPRGRTALAWSGRHIFFVTIPDSFGATWRETADFIRQTLPTILRGQPYNTYIKSINLQCSHA